MIQGSKYEQQVLEERIVGKRSEEDAFIKEVEHEMQERYREYLTDAINTFRKRKRCKIEIDRELKELNDK